MKPITIDPQLQSVLEHLNAARKDFSEAYIRITNEGGKELLYHASGFHDRYRKCYR